MTSVFSIYRSCAFALVLCATSAIPAMAQTPPPALAPPLRLTLKDALSLAADNDPRLQGQTFAAAAADARRAQANLRPPLVVAAEVENILGTDRLATFNDVDATLSLGTTLELGGKRAARVSRAEREKDALLIAQRAERLDVFAEVARRFVAVLRDQAVAAVADENRALALRVQEIVAARVATGNASPVEKHNAEVARIQAELARTTAAAVFREEWGRLVSAWGGSPDSRGEVVGELFATPAIGSFAALQARIDDNPDILRFATERRVREAAVTAAEAAATPDVDVALGVRRVQAARGQALVLSASVPLNAGTRAAPMADEARHQLAGLAFDERNLRNETLGTLHGLIQRAEGAATALGLLQTGAIPAARQAQDEAETAFRAGRSSLLELSAAQQQLLDLRRAAIDAAAEYHGLVIEIERLIGASITPATTETRAP
ncbi:MAG: TolC family protein [Rhodospirillaceae bacterium]|nr:TolC family protein [Rhodospirillaceae bacterium]